MCIVWYYQYNNRIYELLAVLSIQYPTTNNSYNRIYELLAVYIKIVTSCCNCRSYKSKQVLIHSDAWVKWKCAWWSAVWLFIQHMFTIWEMQHLSVPLIQLYNIPLSIVVAKALSSVLEMLKVSSKTSGQSNIRPASCVICPEKSLTN